MLHNYRAYAANQDIIETAVHHREVLLSNMRLARTFVKDEAFLTALLDDALEFVDTPEHRKVFDPAWHLIGFKSRRMLAAPKPPRFKLRAFLGGVVRRARALLH